jgi:hypothetical protein
LSITDRSTEWAAKWSAQQSPNESDSESNSCTQCNSFTSAYGESECKSIGGTDSYNDRDTLDSTFCVAKCVAIVGSVAIANSKSKCDAEYWSDSIANGIANGVTK